MSANRDIHLVLLLKIHAGEHTIFKIFALPGCYAAYIGIYRRFGARNRSHLQESSSPRVCPLKMGQTGCTETSVTTSLRCVKCQKREYIIYTAAEAWNHAYNFKIISLLGTTWLITDMRRATTGIRYEKCVVRRFRCCANVIECTYTNLDSIA